MPYFTLAVSAVVMLLIGGLGMYAKHVTTENATLEANVAQYQTTIASESAARARLQSELDRRDRLIAERDRERARIETKLQDTLRELKALYKMDSVALAWSEQPVPDAVIDILRNSAGGDRTGSNESPSAASTDGADAGASAAGAGRAEQ